MFFGTRACLCIGFELLAGLYLPAKTKETVAKEKRDPMTGRSDLMESEMVIGKEA